jgi:hypothetical protein
VLTKEEEKGQIKKKLEDAYVFFLRRSYGVTMDQVMMAIC